MNAVSYDPLDPVNAEPRVPRRALAPGQAGWWLCGPTGVGPAASGGYKKVVVIWGGLGGQILASSEITRRGGRGTGTDAWGTRVGWGTHTMRE